MTVDHIIEFTDTLIWPLLALVAYLLNFKRLNSIFTSLESRIKAGSEVQFRGFKVGVALSLPEVSGNHDVTVEHLALIHSSWRYPRKDSEFGERMYVFQLILIGQTSTLDRIEFVKYNLHSSYPNRIQIKYDRTSNFELKELAWGESIVRAEVKIKNQEKILKLSRYINLTETGIDLLQNRN